MRIEAVIFDQGGVLSPSGPSGANQKAAAQIMGLGLDQPIDMRDLLEELKRGQIGNDEFITKVNERHPDAPHKLTNEMWGRIYSWWAKPDERVRKLADRCRASGRKVGLLSNINPGMARLLRADGTYEGFEPLVLSCEVGYAKPDPKIYDEMEKRLAGIEPGKILLLDDQKKCTDGAEARGWQTMLVTDLDEMVREVTSLLRLE